MSSRHARPENIIADHHTDHDDHHQQIARGRHAIVTHLDEALTHLQAASDTVESLRALGDTDYTVDPRGLDALHWIADADRATRAGRTITRDIAGPT